MSQFSHGLEGQIQSHSIISLNGTTRLKSLFQHSKLSQFGGEGTVSGNLHLGKPAPGAILSEQRNVTQTATAIVTNVSKLSQRCSAGMRGASAALELSSLAQRA